MKAKSIKGNSTEEIKNALAEGMADFDIIETVISKADKLKAERNSEADALLIFSCAGRLSALGPMAHEENEGLQQLWNAPMAGFYTYGEYGKGLNGKHEFHSTTCSWVALKEK